MIHSLCRKGTISARHLPKGFPFFTVRLNSRKGARSSWSPPARRKAVPLTPYLEAIQSTVEHGRNLHLGGDLFNVFNHAGSPTTISGGVLSTGSSGVGAHTLQLNARLWC